MSSREGDYSRPSLTEPAVQLSRSRLFTRLISQERSESFQAFFSFYSIHMVGIRHLSPVPYLLAEYHPV